MKITGMEIKVQIQLSREGRIVDIRKGSRLISKAPRDHSKMNFNLGIERFCIRW
jgi:hypothetical protein